MVNRAASKIKQLAPREPPIEWSVAWSSRVDQADTKTITQVDVAALAQCAVPLQIDDPEQLAASESACLHLPILTKIKLRAAKWQSAS